MRDTKELWLFLILKHRHIHIIYNGYRFPNRSLFAADVVVFILSASAAMQHGVLSSAYRSMNFM